MPAPFVSGEDRVCWLESLAVGGQADQGFVLETTLRACLLSLMENAVDLFLRGKVRIPSAGG